MSYFTTKTRHITNDQGVVSDTQGQDVIKSCVTIAVEIVIEPVQPESSLYD